MLGSRPRWGLVAFLVIAAALVFFCRQVKPESAPTLSGNTRTRAVEHRPETDDVVEPDAGGRIRKVRDRGNVLLAPRRSKSQLLTEAKHVFGRAEAARARKLAERFGTECGSYLYLVEQPSDGEVETVKAQIADLRNEVLLEDREYFDGQLQQEIKSYDPYGEQERKAFLITVPVEGAKQMRMSGTIMDAGNIDEFHEKFLNDGPVSIMVRQAFVASYDEKTLERFDQLMVWDPEKTK